MTDWELIDAARKRAHSSVQSMWNTLGLARVILAAKVPGCLVECGVFAGSHPAIMAHACREANDDRQVHLFDSFQGIPQAGPHDKEDITDLIGVGDGTGKLISSGQSACSVKYVRDWFQKLEFGPDRFVFHEGWFQDTVPGAPIGPIALLRLDGDLYESTNVCLEEMYPDLSSGGVCIVDDYNLAGCRKAVDEYRDKETVETVLVSVPDSAGVVYWRKW